jgi:hypothetical protein
MVSLGSSRLITGKSSQKTGKLSKHEKIKKKARDTPLPVIDFDNSHPAAIASVGQALTHAPQSVHLLASIWYCPSFSAIASDGHSLVQEPQLTQASLIL